MKILEQLTISELLEQYPFVKMYLEENKLDIVGYEHISFVDFLAHFSEEDIENKALDLNKTASDLVVYIDQMKDFLGIDDSHQVKSLTILAGQNKEGQAECFDRLVVNKSEMVAIVGPTGAGKSRLLADIEWSARADTPTMRTILINGEFADHKWRFSSNNKLVAQLSQNMNFVMDLTVGEFLELHAQSRMVQDITAIVKKIIAQANHLTGEAFKLTTPITSLSGGQSRALMIADTAILSASPIVLIDEIENAGIDRKKALDTLVSADKIVLIATHDPALALLADKRIVINNGGIVKIIKTTAREKQKLIELEAINQKMQVLRKALRYGDTLDNCQ